jgi:hypothetical protein
MIDINRLLLLFIASNGSTVPLSIHSRNNSLLSCGNSSYIYNNGENKGNEGEDMDGIERRTHVHRPRTLNIAEQ